MKQLYLGAGAITAGTDRCVAHIISCDKAASASCRRVALSDSKLNHGDSFPTTKVLHCDDDKRRSERVNANCRESETPRVSRLKRGCTSGITIKSKRVSIADARAFLMSFTKGKSLPTYRCARLLSETFRVALFAAADVEADSAEDAASCSAAPVDRGDFCDMAQPLQHTRPDGLSPLAVRALNSADVRW